MTRPTQFSRPIIPNVFIGGDPDLPDGQAQLDCCADSSNTLPDRAFDIGGVFVGDVVSTLSTEILADGPDWYYKFDEPSGAFVDSSGNGVTATETGSIIRSVTGPFAGDVGITAESGDRLALDYTATSLSDSSFECWFKTTDTGKTVLTENRGGAGESGVALQVAIGPTTFGAAAGQVTAFFNATSYWLGIHTTSTYHDGNWHHLVAVWNGTAGVAPATGQLAIYIDGSSAATTADSGNTGSTGNAPHSGHGDMLLFTDSLAGTSHGTVSVSEAAWYPTALSSGRIADHYTASGGVAVWVGGGHQAVDGDDMTYQGWDGIPMTRMERTDDGALRAVDEPHDYREVAEGSVSLRQRRAASAALTFASRDLGLERLRTHWFAPAAAGDPVAFRAGGLGRYIGGMTRSGRHRCLWLLGPGQTPAETAFNVLHEARHIRYSIDHGWVPGHKLTPEERADAESICDEYAKEHRELTDAMGDANWPMRQVSVRRRHRRTRAA